MNFRHRLPVIGSLIGLTILLATSPGYTQQGGINLPQIGDPSDQVLSPHAERELGEAIMRRIRAETKLVDDPLIVDYLHDLGTRLVASAAAPSTEFNFFIVQNPTINAFAGPGGIIGVHSGLISAARTESQLAGVLAHEIAHVTQRHIARAYAASRNSTLTTAAAVLAALILGGQGGQAALYGGIAARAQQQINFTRENEFEADRIGIQILSRANFSPEGMAEFFEILLRQNSVSGDQVPEYLRTHPLNVTRIAEARSRVDLAQQSGAQRDSLNYQLVRMRLLAMEANDQQTFLRSLENQKRPLIKQYGELVVRMIHEEHKAALEIANTLLASNPDNLFFRLAQARLLSELGETSALKEFNRLDEIYPNNFAIVMAFSEALASQQEYDRALTRLRDYARYSDTPNPEIYQSMARYAERLGQTTLSQDYLAEYHYRNGRLSLAIQALERALKTTPQNTSEAQRLQAKYDAYKQERNELLGKF